MLCGATRILSKIEWWFKFSLKHRDDLYAGCFCPTCKFYDECRDEVERIEEIFGEPFE